MTQRTEPGLRTVSPRHDQISRQHARPLLRPFRTRLANSHPFRAPGAAELRRRNQLQSREHVPYPSAPLPPYTCALVPEWRNW